MMEMEDELANFITSSGGVYLVIHRFLGKGNEYPTDKTCEDAEREIQSYSRTGGPI